MSEESAKTETKQDRIPLFNIYPAIDILEGECVRLVQGDFNESTTYNKNPVFVAKRWQSLGARYLHIVDLDGAKSGRVENVQVVEEIIKQVNIPLQVGGGIRSPETFKRYISAGVDRIIIGSAAVNDPDFVKEMLKEYGGDHVVLGVDVKGEHVAVEGWKKESETTAVDLINEFIEHGLKIIHYTDISRDGMLTGPNIEGLKDLLNKLENKVVVINSGGVTDINDVKDLKALQEANYNVDGVIIGKALYTNKIKPKELFDDSIYF